MQNDLMLSSRLSADPDAKAKIMFDTYPSGYRLHRHEFFELELATGGACLHLLNSERYTFAKGDIVLITPSVLHQFIPIPESQPLEMYTISFSPLPISERFWAQIPVHAFPLLSHLEGDAFTAVRHCFATLYARASKEKLPFDTITETALQWIILNAVSLTPQPQYQDDYAKIRMALIYIQSNFTEPLSLPAVADIAHFSPEYFSQLFHRCVGMSFQDYLLDLRLTFASELFALTELSVSDVCYESGFRTLSYFIRAFRKRFACSPGAFRAEKRETKKKNG